ETKIRFLQFNALSVNQDYLISGEFVCKLCDEIFGPNLDRGMFVIREFRDQTQLSTEFCGTCGPHGKYKCNGGWICPNNGRVPLSEMSFSYGYRNCCKHCNLLKSEARKRG